MTPFKLRSKGNVLISTSANIMWLTQSSGHIFYSFRRVASDARNTSRSLLYTLLLVLMCSDGCPHVVDALSCFFLNHLGIKLIQVQQLLIVYFIVHTTQEHLLAPHAPSSHLINAYRPVSNVVFAHGTRRAADVFLIGFCFPWALCWYVLTAFVAAHLLPKSAHMYSVSSVSSPIRQLSLLLSSTVPLHPVCTPQFRPRPDG